MSRLANILVGYDGFDRSERLPAVAVTLAEEHGARLHVVNVVQPLPRQLWRGASVSAEELHASLSKSRQEHLEHLLKGARKKGLSTRAVVRVGAPHVELIREALEIGADLLVVSDEPLGRDGRRGFGTVTTKLLRECPCPVLAKRDHRRYRHRRILAAVDLEPADPGECPNRGIIDLSVALARHAGSRLFVFSAWNLWGEHLLRGRAGVTEQEIRVYAEETRALHQRSMVQFLAKSTLQGIDVEQILAKGQARDLLPEIVKAKRIDLVVMGTVCRTRLKGVLIGNTAEKVLNELACSVVAVKPDTFISPIGLSDE